MYQAASIPLLCCFMFVAAGIAAAEPPAVVVQAACPVGLPDGTIRGGTLANKKLIHDTYDGVLTKAALMGMAQTIKEEMFVVQNPVGRPGARCWRERWFLTDEKAAIGRFDLLFLEDGRGGASWVLEDAALVPDGVIPRTGDGERAAAMPQLNEKELEGVVRADSERYVDTAMAFVEHATQGRVHEMIALTSPLTIARVGLDKLREIHVENYVPQFKQYAVEWDKECVLAEDDTGNLGITMAGTMQGKKTYRIAVHVMREGGKYVVGGVSIVVPEAGRDAP